jgi:hypothetical protein
LLQRIKRDGYAIAKIAWDPAAPRSRCTLQHALRPDKIRVSMPRYLTLAHAHVGVLLTSLAAVLACSAPPGVEDDDSVPEFSGAFPNAGGVSATPAQNPGVNPAATGLGSPNNEAVGSNSGSIPVNTGSNGPGSNPSSMVGGTGGAGGSAMTGSAMTGGEPTPGTGAGGSGMPTGTVPPGNTPPPVVAPPPVVTPPPVGTPPPVVGAGCGDGAIFCEDFDGINVGALQGTVNGMRVDRAADIVDEAGRGRVLRVQAGTGYGNKAGVFLDNFTAPNNSFFGRVFVRVDQFPTAGGDHWVIVEATANGAGEQVRPVGGQFARWAPGSDGPSAGDWTDWAESDAATTAGAWECVEWQINGANGGNDMLLWVNDNEVQPLDRANFRLPAINTLWFGFVVFQNGQPPAHEVRFDDIVLSTERVGCN